MHIYRISWFMVFVLFTVSACSSQPPTGDIQPPTSDVQLPVNDNSSSISTTDNTDNLSPSWNWEWTIETGDIDKLIVAEDSRIFGLIYKEHPRRHVVIAPNGEINTVVDLPEDERILDRYFLWDRNFHGLSDGTIIIDDYTFTSLVNTKHEFIVFDDALKPHAGFKGSISQYGENLAYRLVSIDEEAALVNGESIGSFYYYHIDEDDGPIMDKHISLPNISDYSFFDTENLARVLAYEYQTEEKLVLYDTEGNLVYNSLPDGLDINRQYRYYLSPWGDIWLNFTMYDAIGVEQGGRVVRIDSSGIETSFEQYPPDIFDIRQIMYLPNKHEIHYVGNDFHALLDQNFQVIQKYTYPSDIEAGNPFIGFDGNLYIKNVSIGRLSKYVRTQ